MAGGGGGRESCALTGETGRPGEGGRCGSHPENQPRVEIPGRSFDSAYHTFVVVPSQTKPGKYLLNAQVLPAGDRRVCNTSQTWREGTSRLKGASRGPGAHRACKQNVGPALQPTRAQNPTDGTQDPPGPLLRPAPTFTQGAGRRHPSSRVCSDAELRSMRGGQTPASRPPARQLGFNCQRSRPIRGRVDFTEPRPPTGDYSNWRPIRRRVVAAEPRPRQGLWVTGEGHGV